MKITLENINEATLQQIFHQAARHMLQQGKKSKLTVRGVGGYCTYRFEDLKCAAGVFISDEMYNKDLEGESINSVLNKFKIRVPLGVAELLIRLQCIHDSASVSAWKHTLDDLAEELGLTNFAKIYVQTSTTELLK